MADPKQPLLSPVAVAMVALVAIMAAVGTTTIVREWAEKNHGIPKGSWDVCANTTVIGGCAQNWQDEGFFIKNGPGILIGSAVLLVGCGAYCQFRIIRNALNVVQPVHRSGKRKP